MISPHLLKVFESYSSSHSGNLFEKNARLIPDFLGWENKPVLVLNPSHKNPKWVHAVLAEGPGLSEGSPRSELVVIWFSEMGPDTERVLAAIPWEKHAKDVNES